MEHKDPGRYIPAVFLGLKSLYITDYTGDILRNSHIFQTTLAASFHMYEPLVLPNPKA